MPVPASITDLSTTAGSNSPPGSESPATIDDYLRAHAAFIAQLRAVIGGATDANIPTNSDFAALANTASSTIGFSTGAGGAVTQATSKSTAVTLNKPVGRITMNAASLAAGSSVSFTFNNDKIAAGDVVVPCISGGASGGAYNVTTNSITPGSCVINLRNLTASALGEAVQLNFVVIKGATS